MNRILSNDYLDARSAAYDAKAFLSPIVADFIDGDDVLDARAWAAFMAGSDWERHYRGRRYTDETTACAPNVVME
jgi:hypothetical protein